MAQKPPVESLSREELLALVRELERRNAELRKENQALRPAPLSHSVHGAEGGLGGRIPAAASACRVAGANPGSMIRRSRSLLESTSYQGGPSATVSPAWRAASTVWARVSWQDHVTPLNISGATLRHEMA